MIQITVTTDNINKMMRELESTIKDLSPPLKQFGNYYEKETEQQFKQEVDPDGIPWAALAPSTLAEKRRLGYPDTILTRTGKMRRSLKIRVSDRAFEVTVDFPAQFHQRGTSKMPQRRILGMSRDRRRKLRDEVRVYVRKRQKRYRKGRL